MSAIICDQCDGQGYVRVLSSSGRPFIGLCACPVGAPLLREMDRYPQRLAQHLGVSIDRIWSMADLRETVGPSCSGKVARR